MKDIGFICGISLFGWFGTKIIYENFDCFLTHLLIIKSIQNVTIEIESSSSNAVSLLSKSLKRAFRASLLNLIRGFHHKKYSLTNSLEFVLMADSVVLTLGSLVFFLRGTISAGLKLDFFV